MDMDNVWDRIKKGLKDGAALSMEKIEEYTRIGKLKIDELGARRKIERNFTDIGERVFDLINSQKGAQIAADVAVTKAVEDVLKLREQLESIAAQIRKINEEAKASTHQSAPDDDEITGV